LALFLYSLERRGDAREAARREMVQLAEEISNEHARQVDQVRELLNIVALTPQVKGKEWRASGEPFAELLPSFPYLANILAVEREGNVMASAVPYEGPVNISDRPYFQRALEEKCFSVGEYLIGRIIGKPILPLAQPVFNEKGEVDSILVAGLSLEWLGAFCASFSHPPGSAIMVVDGRGTVLSYHPEGEGYVGSTVPEAPLMKAILEGEGTGSIWEKGLDGVKRLYIFRPIAGEEKTGRVYVCVGFSEEEMYRSSNRAMVRDLGYLLGLATAILLLAYILSGTYVLKPVGKLQRAVQELEKGDFSARTGMTERTDEIGRLAGSFDRMAESLQARVAERDRAEAELRESEERLSALLEIVPVGIILLDQRGEVAFVNRAAESIFGLKENDMLGRRYDRLLRKGYALDGSPLCLEDHPCRQVLETGEERRGMEYMAEMEDGSTKVLSLSAVPVHDAQGNIVGVLAAVEDVTERHEMLERIERLGLFYSVLSDVNRAIVRLPEKEKLVKEICRIMVESGLFRMAWIGWLDVSAQKVEPIAVFGDTSGYVRAITIRADISPEGCGPTGTSVREVKPVVCNDIQTDPRMAPWRERALASGFRSSGAFPLICEGRVVGTINVYSERTDYFGPQEKQVMENLAADVSFALEVMEREGKRRQAEWRLRKLNQCFLNLEADPLRNMEKISALGAELLSCALAQYWRRKGESYELAFHHEGIENYRPLTTSLPPGDFEDLFLWYRGSLDEKSKKVLRMKEIVPDIDEYGLKSMIGHPVLVGTEFVGCLCLFDLSEREFGGGEVDFVGMLARALSVEEERWRTEEDLRDFMDIASHELRHPITIMKGYALTLAEFTDRLSEEEKRDILKMIDRSADRLSLILEELMEVGRIHRGEFVISRRKVPVLSVIESAVAEARKRHGERIFEVTVKGDAGHFLVDPDKLAFAITALLDNSAKFSSPRHVVSLNAARRGDEVYVSVLDRGPGIPPGEESRIFERFYHVGDVRHHSVPGIGLGLYFARTVVEAHGGRIWYKPRPDGGSVFTIAVPAI
jgi:PAS domain S-box-containing protein